ncbi:tetratricopeptide repeat protein [Paenactinomyces guangxiensis]|uniref:Tetratricopeptide repeat protein n=1 Tax=Paenactinomyces guangxiensis TaxID=1490290 RepID=A0A7W1WR48_9BACL|nr:tetratricopeptide repeat protein [Paenactinomyces guangxiensis]MBA4494520.1 tetratricopeptide repeat protein [Paenactinomyces guangxiensis]MBH8591718.1 tetratricopeptide repeat protein [Paenactinomyces guangxiensis]
MFLKEKGQWIKQYYVMNRFPFVEGMLYYVALSPDSQDNSEESGMSTRFIHALDSSTLPENLDLDSLFQRNEDVFFPIEEVFVEDDILYQVFTKMEGTLFAFYLSQSAPLSLAESMNLLKTICDQLIQLNEENQFTLVHPQNMFLDTGNRIRFLYGGNATLSLKPLQEPEIVFQVGSMLYTMLTKKWIEANGEIERPRKSRADIPLELENILIRSLSPDPSKRPNIQELSRIAHYYSHKAPKKLPETTSAEIPAPQWVSTTRVTDKTMITKTGLLKKLTRRKKIVLAVAGSLAFLIIGAVIITSLFSSARADSTPQQKAAAWYQQAQQEVKNQHLDKAIELGEKAVQADPQKKYYIYLANLYRASQKYDKGIELLTEATKKYPKDPRMFYELSVLAYYSKDYETANEAIQTAIQLSDNKVSGYFYMHGKVLIAKKEYTRAVQTLNRAIELKGDRATYYHERSIALYRNGKLDEAIKNEQKAIQLEPEQGKYDFTLGIIYLQKREEAKKAKNVAANTREKQMDNWTQKALTSFEEAAKDLPRDPDVHYYRSVAYFYQNKFEPSLKAVDQAIKFLPSNALLYYQKGLAHLGLNQKDAAAKAFKKAVELDPQSKLYQEALNKAQK